MQFDSLEAFFNMGGYALYVWLSFGVTFLSMLVLAVQSRLEGKHLFKQVLKERTRRNRIMQARKAQRAKPVNSNNDS